MKKTLLLTAAAVSAIAFAGAANAASVSYRAGTNAVVDATTNPYRLARELNFGAGVAATTGQFDVIVNTNTALTPGTYTIQLDYAGGTITTAPSGAVVTDTAATTVAATNVAGAVGFQVSNGGGSTLTLTQSSATSVTYTLQIPAAGSVQAVAFSNAITVTGPLTVTAAIRNQVTGQVVEPSVIQNVVSNTAQGFAVNIDRTLTAADAFTTRNALVSGGAGLDTRVEEGAAGNPFNTLTNAGPVGQVNVAVSGSGLFNNITGATTASQPVYRDLNGTAVALSDVSSVAITVRGLLAGYQLNANNDAAAAFPAGAFVDTTNQTVITAPGGANVGTTTVSIGAATAVATSPQLAPTDLDVSAQLALATGFTAPAATVGSFETIQSDGFSYIIPWVASSTLSGANGNQSVIRVSNIRSDASTPGGNVYAQVYNATGAAAGLSAGRSVLVGTLGVSGELIITSASLQAALGDFGRGDIRLTITTTDTTGNNLPGSTGTQVAGPPVTTTTTTGSSTIVVKRLIATANGGLTEVEVVAGANGSEANLPVNQGVAY